MRRIAYYSSCSDIYASVGGKYKRWLLLLGKLLCAMLMKIGTIGSGYSGAGTGLWTTKVPTVRLQILISLLLVLVPALLMRSLPNAEEAGSSVLVMTVIGCLAASTVSILLISNIRHYPGVEEVAYIGPAFLLSHGMLMAIWILARMPYSRILLTVSLLLHITVFVIMHLMMRRNRRLRIGIVPEGSYGDLLAAPGVDWRILEGPGEQVDDLDAVSADLWCDLPDEWERTLARFALNGLPVYHAKHLRESLTGRVEMERLSENTFGTLSPLQAYMSVKHLVDWVAALAALIVLAPVMVMIAAAIRLGSPGPVLFRQVRVGYRGGTFEVYKFRTMIADDGQRGCSADLREAAITRDNDCRITGVGRYLRMTRLDELPQLLNVLKGEMSWIGPRPEAEVLSRWYESEIPFYRYRHIVRPGITGWAQVHQGHVTEVAQVREKLHRDFYYIKNFSPWIDFIIVICTIRTMMSGFGSR